MEYSDWIKGFYAFILSLPFILLFICWATILCRYKSKIFEGSEKIKGQCSPQSCSNNKDIVNGKAGKAAALPKFSDMLTLSEPRG
jgi:hypothetical protein